jgi:hypothetical protein
MSKPPRTLPTVGTFFECFRDPHEHPVGPRPHHRALGAACGGAAAAGSPAVACFVGGTMADAAAITEQMALISAGRSTRFKLPTWENAGTPLGVDVRRVVETTTTPRTSSDVLGRLATSRSRC